MKKTELQGMIKRHADGFGFFIPDDSKHPDVYIPKQYMHGVMTRDRVLIEAFPERGGERYRGKILEILKRGQAQAVGRFHLTEWGGKVLDEGHGWGQDIIIEDDQFSGAEDGDMVSVNIIAYPGDDGDELIGSVRAVIGDVENPMNDIRRVIHANGVAEEFTKEVLATKIPTEVAAREFDGRQDLTDLDFITIDGVTAKDFDDAIYVKATSQGFLLWVAIADVSHYVKPDSPIDEEAYERGTSTYFPNFVVPMLPESLSNGICSLLPNENRLAMVAKTQINYSGEVISKEFFEAVICSKSRVTYGEAQEVVDGIELEKHAHVAHVIKKAAQLAELLMVHRMKQGSLNLEIPETDLVIDESGQPVDIIRSERLFAHKMIEEMMLVANVAVAEFLSELEAPAFFRIHDEPKGESIEILSRYLRNFGGTKKLEGGKLQKKISRALREFAGKPEAQVLNILTLRSLSQAQYSMENIGHFGLGFPLYTHFTSPIRRYPDLIVHRLLKAAVHPGRGYAALSEHALATAGTHLSACEQRSVKAERQLHSIKKARFMSRHLGEEFDGVISSVTKFGVFVLLREFDVDGLVKVDELGREPFHFDEEMLRLIGKRSGFLYSIGQNVRVQVAKADAQSGMIDFVLAGELDSVPQNDKHTKFKSGEKKGAFKASKRKNTKKRGKSSKNRKRSGKARVSGRS